MSALVTNPAMADSSPSQGFEAPSGPPANCPSAATNQDSYSDTTQFWDPGFELVILVLRTEVSHRRTGASIADLRGCLVSGNVSGGG